MVERRLLSLEFEMRSMRAAKDPLASAPTPIEAPVPHPSPRPTSSLDQPAPLNPVIHAPPSSAPMQQPPLQQALSITIAELQNSRSLVHNQIEQLDLSGLTFDGVMECWTFFVGRVLPQSLYGCSLPSSPRPSPLLLSAVLAISSRLHPSPALSNLHPSLLLLFQLAVTDLLGVALSVNPRPTVPYPAGDLDDIVGLVLASLWLEPGGESSRALSLAFVPRLSQKDRFGGLTLLLLQQDQVGCRQTTDGVGHGQ